MLGTFTYANPTRIHFGERAMDDLPGELDRFGQNVLLVYGGGSIKRNGIYDQVTSALEAAGKNIFEVAGVMSNPTAAKLDEGCQIARTHDIDLILGVGGGSVCDYSKALSISIHCDEDPWQKYWLHMESPTCPIVPVGCILTMVGTGSEMNGGSVITNHDQHLKIGHVFGPEVFPRFSILNPRLTLTVPRYQMVSGIFDIMSHILEQYFSGTDDCTSDYVMEGMLRSLVHSARVAVADPEDYEARSNIMWLATWALNTFVACGKATDWEVHMIGQAIGAYTDATHGMTLAAVSIPYYRHIMDAGLPRFVSYAVNVWDVDATGKTDQQVASEGLDAMEAFMDQMGVVMHASELGVTPEMYDGIADATFILEGGYKVLDHDEVVEVLRESA